MTSKNKNRGFFWLIGLVLGVPLVPFLVIGWWLEPAIESVATNYAQLPVWQSAGLTIIFLTIDIFLPVPSSVVLTLAGQALGTAVGTVIGWIGLNLSAAFGYWAGRKLGPSVNRICSTDGVEDVKKLERWSMWWTLFALRPLPILAEASVLLCGLRQVPGRQFWPPIVISNLLISLVWCVLGDFASDNGWFPVAMAISMALPLLFIAMRFWWTRHSGNG